MTAIYRDELYDMAKVIRGIAGHKEWDQKMATAEEITKAARKRQCGISRACQDFLGWHPDEILVPGVNAVDTECVAAAALAIWKR